MNATIISNNDKHYPVLLDEILSIISPQNGGTFIDCTFGQGGYSKAILKFPKTKIFALDRDIHSEKYANELKTILNEIKSNVGKPATFIAESVMGCGGQIIPPKAFFKKAYQMDEVFRPKRFR